MGVRGLTTFIARNSDKYLEHYELHDTYLVIDGNNLAAQLYKWHAKCYDCFGGDYNEYARTIVNFFQMLKQSNVTPLVIFDGGYEDRKLTTIYSRMKSRIKQARDLNCATEGAIPVFPLFLRELFVELILKLGLKTARCIVEADYEMACIARTLNCPVLSYDSDFYIFDVMYVPFSTIEMKCTKIKNSLRGSYNCIQCQIYTLDKLLKSFGGLKKENVPLLGTLLGNDYIKANVFNNFYDHIKLAKRKYAQSDQQRRIAAVIKWLQNETYESAVRKILGRIKIVSRTDVAKQIQFMTDGYRCSESKLIKYLDVKVNNIQTNDSNRKLYLNLDIKVDLNDDQLSKEMSEDCNSTESGSNSSLVDTSAKHMIDVGSIPNFFEVSYQKCLYPACFMDICCRNRYFFIPQIENYENICSHDISLNILSAIYKILSINDSKQLKCVIRHENAGLRNLYLDKSSKELPTLYDLKSIGIEEASNCLHNVLETTTNVRNILIEYPSSWRLYMLSVIYWIQHVQPKITSNHMYSILLSAVILKANQHLPAVIHSDDTSKQTVQLSKNEKITLMQKIKRYFQIDIKLRKNPKLFNVDIVDSFAQFQSCALHIKYLNTLLGNPLEDYVISDFYNGTLIYNFYNDIINRNDVNAYINVLLNDSPSILNTTNKMIHSLISTLPDCFVTTVGSKRRKKRKKKNSITQEVADINTNEENTVVYDVNNKFSLLAFC